VEAGYPSTMPPLTAAAPWLNGATRLDEILVVPVVPVEPAPYLAIEDDGPFALVPTTGGPVEQPQETVDNRPAILVVEDNDDTRALLEHILRSQYRVTAVGDARSALDHLNKNGCSGLVLDINLGGKQTGADILRIARTIPGNEQVFAVALTAYALPGDRERFLKAGFDQYVSKPFTRATLMAALREGVPNAA
jgi:CheY-like chemotaxis protein